MSEKKSKLAIEVKTCKVQYKAVRKEVQDLKKQVNKLQCEKKELKKKVIIVKSSEKLMVSFGNLVPKAKAYFNKMLNSFGEVQELRERLSKAIQLNNVIKFKLKIKNDSMENDELSCGESDLAENASGCCNVL